MAKITGIMVTERKAPRRVVLEDNIEVDLLKARGCEPDASGPEHNRVQRFCDYGNETSDSVKFGEFLDRLSNCQLPSQGSPLDLSCCQTRSAKADCLSVFHQCVGSNCELFVKPYISAASSGQDWTTLGGLYLLCYVTNA
jgi:hypothetical protein